MLLNYSRWYMSSQWVASRVRIRLFVFQLSQTYHDLTSHILWSVIDVETSCLWSIGAVENWSMPTTVDTRIFKFVGDPTLCTNFQLWGKNTIRVWGVRVCIVGSRAGAMIPAYALCSYHMLICSYAHMHMPTSHTWSMPCANWPFPTMRRCHDVNHDAFSITIQCIRNPTT